MTEARAPIEHGGFAVHEIHLCVYIYVCSYTSCKYVRLCGCEERKKCGEGSGACLESVVPGRVPAHFHVAVGLHVCGELDLVLVHSTHLTLVVTDLYE